MENHNNFKDLSIVESDNAIELEKKKSDLFEKFTAGVLLVGFTALSIYNPIVVRSAYKEAEHHKCMFVGSTTVFAMEFFKAIFCCVVLLIKCRSFKEVSLMLVHSFTINKVETLKICMPALMFVIQNNLYFYALRRIDATLFSVTFQLRILTTVLLMIIVLRRRFNFTQWVSLCLSLVGVIIVQLGSDSQKHSTQVMNPNVMDNFLGLGATLIMCVTTAFGNVYLEALMKESNADIFLQNIRLSLISLPMSVAVMVVDLDKIENHGLFHGWNFYVWIVIIVTALARLLVTMVIKRTDNVKKGFCQALAIGGTACVGIYLGDSMFSYYLLFGILIVIGSVILYGLGTRQQRQESEIQAYMESSPQEGNSLA